MTAAEITTLLRRRIIADLHLGKLKPGTRLPSLRIVAREMGVSIRAAARAYEELQREGLVTVRGRSGVYVVLPKAVEIDLEEPLTWYAEMLRDAWLHRLTLVDVNALLQQLVENPMRVACVESTEDHMVAFCAELADDFALETVSVKLTPDGPKIGDEVMTLYECLASVDFAVTTAFHASEVRLAADVLKKPVVIVSANEVLVDTLEAQLQNGPITIIADDRAFVERFRTYLAESFRQNGDMRAISLDDVAADPAVAVGTTALYTRAARARLNEEEYHLLPPPIPFISASAARKVLQCMLSAHSKRALQTA